MRILLLTIGSYTAVGGVSSHMASLKNELERKGFSVDVLSFSSLGLAGLLFYNFPGFLLNLLDGGLGYYYRFPAITLILGLICFVKQIFNKYDLIHCHDVVAYSSTWFIRKIFNVPVVLTIHGYLRDDYMAHGKIKKRHAWIFSLFESFAKNAKVQLAADTRIRDYVINEVGAAPENIRSYKNFVESDLFTNKEIDKVKTKGFYNLPNDKILLFCPRRLVLKNGVINAIKAMGHLSDNYVLVIAGKGHEMNYLKNYADNNHKKKVIFLGSIPNEEMPKLYLASDYTIIPSITVSNVEEATSISAVESMAAGIPVIASDIGGLRELITDKKNGLLVPQSDPKAIAKAIEWYEQNPTEKEKIIFNAKDKVEKELSSRVVVQNLIDVDYKKAIEAARNLR